MTTPPHDLDSERGLLGDLIALPHRIAEVGTTVTTGDFYSPANALVFAALVSLHSTGQTVSGEAVREELAGSGTLEKAGGTEALTLLALAGSGAWKRHAGTVARLGACRRIMALMLDAARTAGDPTSDPLVLVADVMRDLGSVQLPTVELPTALNSIDVLIDEAESSDGCLDLRLPWVIPGQLRQGWRCMLVAPEGAGKSTATRQMAMAAAQGVHPFTFKPIDPISTLIVDLENPIEAITETASPIRQHLKAKGVYKDNECWVWHEPGGIDLRQPRWRAEFERVIAAVRPGLVCLGPIYKAYRTSARESDELAAGEVQNVFDDLRTRYGFALVLEHHAPKASGGVRDLLPYGSSLWLRWPEFGIKLVPGDDGSLTVGRWRGDRVKAAWPDRLDRGESHQFPWVGYWRDGMGQF